MTPIVSIPIEEYNDLLDKASRLEAIENQLKKDNPEIAIVVYKKRHFIDRYTAFDAHDEIQIVAGSDKINEQFVSEINELNKAIELVKNEFEIAHSRAYDLEQRYIELRNKPKEGTPKPWYKTIFK